MVVDVHMQDVVNFINEGNSNETIECLCTLAPESNLEQAVITG